MLQKLILSYDKKSFNLKLQNMQSLLLKTMTILTVSTDTLYKGKNLDQAAKRTLVKDTIRNCADMMMLLGKINFQLLSRRRECIGPELNFNFKALNFVPGDHPKLLFGDDLMKSVKDITENNEVEPTILKKTCYSSTLSKNPNKERPFLYHGRKPQRGRLRSNPYYRQRGRRWNHNSPMNNHYFQQDKQRRSQQH